MLVYVLDDDAAIRRAMTRLLQSAGLQVQTFQNTSDFLSSMIVNNNSCAIVDIRMPGMNGLQLQQALDQSGIRIPIIFVTAHDTEETRLAAVQGGASAYFRKPVDDLALLDAIHWAVRKQKSSSGGEIHQE